MFIFSLLHKLLHVSLYQAPSPRSVSSSFTRHALSPHSSTADCLLQAGGLSLLGSSRTGNFLISAPSPCLFTPFSAKIFHILISTCMLKHFYRSIKLTNNPSLFHSLPLPGMILHFPLTSLSSFPSPLFTPPPPLFHPTPHPLFFSSFFAWRLALNVHHSAKNKRSELIGLSAAARVDPLIRPEKRRCTSEFCFYSAFWVLQSLNAAVTSKVPPLHVVLG